MLVGYDDARRRLAKHLGVDPYTRNTVLAKKMDGAAWALELLVCARPRIRA